MTGIHSLRGLRAHQAQNSRIQNQQVQHRDQVGKQLITTTTNGDEFVFTVPFVLVFIEQPTPAFGYSLDTNQSYTVGKMPTAQAMVHSWEEIIEGPSTSYLGARIGVVTTGEPGQRIWVHYTFSGQALSFPAPSSPTNSTGTA